MSILSEDQDGSCYLSLQISSLKAVVSWYLLVICTTNSWLLLIHVLLAISSRHTQSKELSARKQITLVLGLALWPGFMAASYDKTRHLGYSIFNASHSWLCIIVYWTSLSVITMSISVPSFNVNIIKLVLLVEEN